ncbi:MAG: AarF/UbiB family protein [Acidimicrobiales bacterium]|nr:AarF/UbiB family protein [Acidimicrobiales bacterium]
MRPSHLARYKDIGTLLVKHRQLVRDRPDGDLLPEDEAAMTTDAEALASELEAMGPTFVKLGQLLSTRADLLPAPYLSALARLQDAVEPFGFAEVEEIVTRELGVRILQGFRSFEDRPVASASLGQVHRAELRDGRRVAVKVQRPHIREQIVDDMDAIEEMARFADQHVEAGRRLGFADMVAEFRTSLFAELDYRQEAANLQALGANLAEHERIVVPQPVADYCTGLVLTMDWVEGRSIGAVGPLGLMEVDGPGLARALFSAYLDQILVHGLFHADPHPGNVLVTEDGALALLDLGMVARTTPEMQDRLVTLLLALGEGRGRDAADVAIAIGRQLDGFQPEDFRRRTTDLVGRSIGTGMRDLQAGALVAELTQIASESGLRLPPELTMLGKALLNLDEVARKLDPDFDPNAAIQEEGGSLLQKKLLQAASPGNVLAAAMGAKEFAERLPGRVNQVMDALADGQLTLNIQGIDEQNIMRGVQKLANRVAGAVVVASLVIGAALIMNIETEAELFGYPALAIVLFLVAAACAVWMLVSIFLGDLPQRRRPRRGERGG